MLPELLCIGVTCLQAEVFPKILFETKLGTKFLLKASCRQLISSKSGYWIIHNCSQAGLRKLNRPFWKWHVLPRVVIDRPAENQWSNQREHSTWTLKQRLLNKSGGIDLPSLFFYPWSATLQLHNFNNSTMWLQRGTGEPAMTPTPFPLWHLKT